MRRRAAAIFLAVVLVLALVGGWALRRSRRQTGAASTPPAAAPVIPQSSEVTLYFPGEDGRLYPERREVESAPGASARARAALAALLAGPHGEGLHAPLPAGVEVGSVVLLGDGTVIVDLRSADREQPPAAGSLGERSMVFSLVDTVLLNVETSKRVALLWNGVQRESFSGHLDTARALTADTGLVAAQ